MQVYISKNLENYTIREDLCLDLDRCEDIWVEIELGKAKKHQNSEKTFENIVVGVVYRHPGSQFKEFEKQMCRNIALLNQNNTKFTILGDMNLNLLKYNIVTCFTDYLNNLQGAGCLSYINDKPTRLVKRGNSWETSCLDHIYSNLDSEKLEASVIMSNISDHYSTFLKISAIKDSVVPKTDVYCRKNTLSQVEENNLNAELKLSFENANLSNLKDIDEKTNVVINTCQNMYEKYFPWRKLSRKEKKFLL